MRSLRALLIALTCLACGPSLAADRPNFLLIIADDLNWHDLGFTGSSDVQTPNLDRLRSEGMYLRQMYTPATCCSPSRHALYTGLYPIRSGAYPNHTRVYDGTKSLFSHLNLLGYRTALQNKEHVGPPKSFPYEHLSGADDLTETKKFIIRNAEQPWLLVYASNDPHGPWTRGPQAKHDSAKVKLPEYLLDTKTTRLQVAAYHAEIEKLDEQVGALLQLLDDTKQTDETLVMFVSEQGSSFPYGGKWSVYDNGIRAATLARWPGKIVPSSTSDAMVQYVDVAPTFLAAAGIDPTKIDVGCPDADGRTGFDGRSFFDVLQGKSAHIRDYIFAQHTTIGIKGAQEAYPMRAVRDARFKYIRNLAPDNTYAIGGIHKGELYESWQRAAENDPQVAARVKFLSHRPAEELYDVTADEFENKNLADDPSYADVKARLRHELDAWMTQQKDKGMETELNAPSRQGRPEKEEDDGEAPNKKKKASKKAKDKA